MTKPRKSLADLVPSAPPKVEVEEPAVKPKKTKSTPAAPPPEQEAEAYVDGIYIFDSESSLNKSERAFYLKRRKKYLEEYSLNDSADMGIIHRIIMEEILGERVYTKLLDNPENPVLAQQLTESNKRYNAAMDTLGASRDKRIKNRESGGVSVADLAKTFFDEGKFNYAQEKTKRDLEDQAIEEQQREHFEMQFGSVLAAGTWSEEDGYTDGD